jgi:hypothetical protein
VRVVHLVSQQPGAHRRPRFPRRTPTTVIRPALRTPIDMIASRRRLHAQHVETTEDSVGPNVLPPGTGRRSRSRPPCPEPPTRRVDHLGIVLVLSHVLRSAGLSALEPVQDPRDVLAARSGVEHAHPDGVRAAQRRGRYDGLAARLKRRHELAVELVHGVGVLNPVEPPAEADDAEHDRGEQLQRGAGSDPLFVLRRASPAGGRTRADAGCGPGNSPGARARPAYAPDVHRRRWP